ncbi:hypothetical protein HGRIS_012539 [Hohenbuehelia grisea]|uniref:Phosphoglycerate mutase n=1 Tax=Hohenbuehelia grisea TaxID=104357 RepID=A0ABR3ISP8_9AGAR
MVNLASKVLGIILLARHGDRLEFFQDPLTYTPSETTLTALGTVQVFRLGSFLRSRYLNPRSSSFISGINTDLVDINQLLFRADAAGEGSIILSRFTPWGKGCILLHLTSKLVWPMGPLSLVPWVDINTSPSNL